MNSTRRSFLKKAAISGAAIASGAVGAIANSSTKEAQSPNYDGVVVGKTNKKEILYKDTKAWDEYYKRAL